jgi:glycosyltransferase involved in cell wall biosynthesis
MIVEQCLAPVPGGTGRYTVEVGRAVAAAAPAGATVTGWTAWHRDPARARLPGVGGPRRLPLPRRLLTVAWEHRLGPAPARADVVHAPTLLVPPKRGRPLVVTLHDAVPWTHPETLTPRGVAWHRRMADHAAREADRIIVPTQAVADDLSRVLDLGDRVTVVGEGVSAALRLPADAAQRADRLRLPTDGYLMSLATLEPRKGLDVLIDALAHPGAPDLPLVVVGQPGWGGVDPARQAERAGIDPGRIRVLGRLDDTDLAVALAGATALVVPSRAEGFGLPVVEAMSVGTAVVSSDAPALVEVGGGATVVVRREDPAALAAALHDVAADEGLRQRLVAAGRDRAASYRWDTAAEQLWKLYTDLSP